MNKKIEAIKALLEALTSTTKMLHNTIDKQTELGSRQVDLIRYQCETNNELISDMWKELNKDDPDSK